MKTTRIPSFLRKFRNSLSALCVAAVTAGLPLAAHAGKISDMYIFGDSLSDTGNLQAMTTQLYDWQYFPFPYPSNPQTPYYQGRFSNGPVWVERLVEQMNIPAVQAGASGFSLGTSFGGLSVAGAGGNNYAVAGARTATTGFFEQFNLSVPTGVQTQVEAFLTPQGGRVPKASALYVVLAGGNNIRDAALHPDQALRGWGIAQAVRAYVDAIGKLADAGAGTILVGNVNDIGKIPEMIYSRHSGAATVASRLFNALLAPQLDLLEKEKGVQLIRLNVYGIFDAVYEDTTQNGGRRFGLTNASVPCFAGFANSGGANCDVSIFSDDIHPTASVHRILARAAAACRDADGNFLGQQPDSARFYLSRFCQTKQSR